MKIFRRYFEEEKANLITLSFSPINRVEKLSISHKGLERKRECEGKAWLGHGGPAKEKEGKRERKNKRGLVRKKRCGPSKVGSAKRKIEREEKVGSTNMFGSGQGKKRKIGPSQGGVGSTKKKRSGQVGVGSG